MDLKEELGRVMRQYVDKNIVAGVNLLVEKDGQEICYCQAGLADRENGKEITRDTIFRLYSQTKPVTAAAAMILQLLEWTMMSYLKIQTWFLSNLQ